MLHALMGNYCKNIDARLPPDEGNVYAQKILQDERYY